MITKSISNPDIFKIIDECDYRTHFGGDQKWYPEKWQQLSGCGPVVACNLFFYSGIIKPNGNYINRDTFLSLMQDVWKYVTPSIKGIPTTKMFYNSVLAYAKSKGTDIKYEVLNLPRARSARPRLSEVLKFLDRALSQDVPIAFLNLNNGEEKNIDSWHWVTIISLEYEEDESSAFMYILDEGSKKKINLCLWYKTTTLGGGFVYFKLGTDENSYIS